MRWAVVAMTGYGRGTAYLGKIVPPVPAPHVIDRPRVSKLLAGLRKRVTALTAGAGFGKTTALTSWASGRNSAWYTVTGLDRDPLALAHGLVASLSLRVPGLSESIGPALDGARGPDPIPGDVADALAPMLAGTLHARLTSEVTLIIDDLQELDGSPSSLRLIGGLCQMAPPMLRIVLASRGDLPPPVERLRIRGQLAIVSAPALGFIESETETLLGALGGFPLSGRAAAVQRLTGGWPAAVRIVGEALIDAADPDELLATMAGGGTTGPSGLVADVVATELLASAPELRDLLTAGAALESFDARLLAALGITDAERVLAAAARRGIHVAPVAEPEGWFELTPLTRQYALARLATDPVHVEKVRVEAARWHAARGEFGAALRYLTLAGDGAGVARMLAEHGSSLLATGSGRAVRDALVAVPAQLRTAAIDLVEGEAHQIHGDWDRAVGCLSRLVTADGAVPAAAAWRLGLIHHMRGEPERALTIYRNGFADQTGALADRALSAAWGAAAAWLTGDVAACRELADAAGELAEQSGDSRALAATHTAWAMLAALTGDRRANDMHYLRALEHAQRAGDVLQIIRIRVNRGSHFLEEGYYREALVELDAAVGLSEFAGFGVLRTIALTNRGEAARRLGRLDDAAHDNQTALAEQQRLGSALASYALTGLAAVYSDQGHASLARARFQEALALAEPTGDLQGLVPALTGLATTVAVDDPEAAEAYARRALAAATTMRRTEALLAMGWVALRQGSQATLHHHAEAAYASALAQRDRAGIAESLELRGAAATDPAQKRRLLAEAEALWEALACPLPLARTRLGMVQAGVAADEEATLWEVEQACRALGARALVAEAAAVQADRRRGEAAQVSVRTLGGFRVLRRGVPVPHQAWQSRKARDLLKLLIARRGAPVPRDVLTDLLWPDGDPARTSGRLSVALSTLRSVLDPEKEHPPDEYVVSIAGALRLRADRVAIDVEVFLRAADAALAAGDREALSLAEAAYTGDFCEEDPYSDWAGALRDEARSAYVAVARALATRHAADGDPETASRYLLRLLACEPYDESAHVALVRQLDAAGRHGDARRRYREYAARMAELEVEPAPYPAPAPSASI